MNLKKYSFIALALFTPQFANAQSVVKNIAGPVDNPPYAAIKPYWIDTPVIEVIGRSNMLFEPNRATMNFTIQEINENADEGLAKLTKRTKPVIEKVKSMLAKEDAISVNYRRQAIYEQYKDKEGNKIQNTREDKIEKYVLYWDISITTHKTENISKIKSEILAIGDARMNGAEYYSFVPSAEQSREVFQAAVKDGAERAKLISSINGNRTKLLVIQEGQSQCLSSPTTQIGNVYPNEDARYEIAPAPPPAPIVPSMALFANKGAAPVLQASDLIMPSAPNKHPMSASVCMVFSIEK